MSLVHLVGTGLLVWARIGGLFLTMPVINAQGVPKHVKVFASLAVAVTVAPTVEVNPDADHLSVMILGTIGEVVFGSLLGLMVRTVFAAFALAANLAAGQAGLAGAQLMDPFLKTQESGLGPLASWLAAIVFLTTGMHNRCIEAVAWSFSHVGPGGVGMPLDIAPTFVQVTSSAFQLGFQLAGPILAMAWLINLFIAILGKIAPRMNAFFAMGSTVSAVMGLLMVVVSLPWILSVHSAEVFKTVESLGGVVQQVR